MLVIWNARQKASESAQIIIPSRNHVVMSVLKFSSPSFLEFMVTGHDQYESGFGVTIVLMSFPPASSD